MNPLDEALRRIPALNISAEDVRDNLILGGYDLATAQVVAERSRTMQPHEIGLVLGQKQSLVPNPLDRIGLA